MRRYLNRIAGATALWLAAVPGIASAGPFVSVSIGTPAIVAPEPHLGVVIARPIAPAPGWMWVEGTWRRDVHGRPLFVAGHWEPAVRAVAVARPTPHAVVVHRY